MVDTKVPKRDDGHPLLEHLKNRPKSLQRILGAMRLASPGTTHVVAAFRGHVSRFPVLPLQRYDYEDAQGMYYEAVSNLSRRDRRRLKRAIAVSESGPAGRGEYNRLLTALDRFNSAFRLTKPGDNIVDSVVALEGLYDVQAEELRRRLALRVALLIGQSDDESAQIYSRVQAAYSMRNTLVHGRGDREDIDRSLRRLAKQIADNAIQTDDLESLLLAAANRIRDYLWRSLWAFIHLNSDPRGPLWPKDDDAWDRLLFDRNLRRSLSRTAAVIVG